MGDRTKRGVRREVGQAVLEATEQFADKRVVNQQRGLAAPVGEQAHPGDDNGPAEWAASVHLDLGSALAGRLRNKRGA